MFSCVGSRSHALRTTCGPFIIGCVCGYNNITLAVIVVVDGGDDVCVKMSLFLVVMASVRFQTFAKFPLRLKTPRVHLSSAIRSLLFTRRLQKHWC